MTTPLRTRQVARLFEQRTTHVGPPTVEERDRAIAAIAVALRTRRVRRHLRVAAAIAGALTVAAAAMALVRVTRVAPSVASAPPPASAPAESRLPPDLTRAVNVIAHPAGDGALVVSASNEPLVEGEALAPGSRIIARPGGRAILAFSTGTRLTVEDGGDLTLVDGGPTSVVALGRGLLRADVAKLHEHERFLVRTDDAEVEVRGTSFTVRSMSASECGGSATRVEVFEGVVVVRSGGAEARIVPGGSWTTPCSAQPSPSAPPTLVHGRSSSGSAKTNELSLAAQNDLFATAVSAKQHGNAGAAAERFGEFLSRYPASPLAESAAAQQMKLLRAIDLGRARAAAKAYAARWPDGFARPDADEILVSSGGSLPGGR